MSSVALRYLKQMTVLRQKMARAEREIADIDRRLGAGNRPDRQVLSRLRKDLKDRSQVYVQTYITIVDQINNLEAGTKTHMFREILSMRYIDGLGMIQIADRLRYSLSYVNSCHSRALRVFADQYLKKKEGP